MWENLRTQGRKGGALTTTNDEENIDSRGMRKGCRLSVTKKKKKLAGERN